LSLIDGIRAVNPGVPIVILASVDSPYLRSEAISRGFAAFLSRAAEPESMLEALAASTRPSAPN
jgi:DNA-binding NarL/FixJ family response regulator